MRNSTIVKSLLRTSLFSGLFSILSLTSFGQTIQTVPGDYPTIAAAVTAINGAAVPAGGYIINVAAGHTETISAPISLTATGTSADPIIIQKSGVGANPLITAYTGTVTPTSATKDGMFNLVGSDYVTIDGIDLFDPNTTNPATMEYGYALFKASATNGCQNNRIQNCTITLNRINNAGGTAPGIEGSVGIYILNATAAAQTTALAITAAAGSNSFNKFYSNTIQNVNYGMGLIGFADASPYTNADKSNDVGGISPGTGNTIINFGGGGTTSPSAAIRTLAQYDLNISYNTINNNNGSGINHGSTLRGIYTNTAAGASETVSFNTITLKSGASASQLSGIENSAGGSGTGNVIGIFSNQLINFAYPNHSSGTIYGIYNTSATAANLNINGNNFDNWTLNSTTAGSGGVNFIYNSSVISVLKNVNNNTIQNMTNLNTSGTVYLVYISNNTNSYNVKDNQFLSISKASGVNGFIYGVYSGSSPTGGTATISGNQFNNISTSGTGGFYGIYSFTASSQTAVIYNNTLTSITAGSGVLNGIYCTYSPVTMYGNSVNNLQGAGTINGLFVGNTSTTSANVYGNIVNTLYSTGATATVSGAYLAASGASAVSDFYNNKIFDLQNNQAGGLVYGINVNASITQNIHNNLIGDLRTPASTGSNSIAGIYLNSGAITVNARYNTVYLNASSSGTNFGSSAIYASSTPTVSLLNNIFINKSTATGTGVTAVYRRSSTTLTSYASSSNNNIFYAGTPSATNVIFSDGTSTDQTFGAYQGRVSPRDNASRTEDVNFLSTTGSSSNFLHVNPSVASFAEGGGIPVAGITNDYDLDTRNTTTPDIGADEFAGTPIPVCSGTPTAGTISGAASVCSGSSATLSLSGASTDPGITYQWMSSTISGGPYSNEGTGLSLSTGALTSTKYYIVVVTCSYSSQVASTIEFPVTVNPIPSVTVTPTSGTICNPGGTAVNLTANGATTYSWTPTAGLTPSTGASVSANPASTTTYTVTGTDGNGCSNTATSTVNVSTTPVIGSVTASPANVCTGGSSTLSVSVNPLTYCASTHSNGCGTGGDAMLNVSLNGLVNASGCSATAAYTMYTTPTTTLNAGTAYPLAVSFGSDGTQYFGAWIDYNQDGTFAASEFLGASTNAGANGTATVNFTVPANALSGATRLRIVGGNDSPVTAGQACGASSSSYGETEDYIVTISSATPALTFAWSPSTFLGSTTTPTVTASGITATTTYTASVTNLAGCSSAGTASVSVDPLTALNVTSSGGNTICGGSSVTLTATPTGGGAPYTYSWSSGETTAAITASPSVTTTYTVSVTDNCGSSAGNTFILNVNPAPAVTATPGSSTICIPGGSAVSLTASGATTYNWTPTAGLTPSTGASVSANPSASTTYTVTGTDGIGCKATATAIVNVSTSVTVVNMAATPANICTGTSSTLSGVGQFQAGSYCVGPYTTGTTSNDYITNVTLGAINNTTGASASPFNTYYNTMNANLTAGSPYTVTGTINNGGTEGIAAWIDYNQNGVFEASEKIGQQTGLTFSLAFTVPTSAYNGVTRLRVRNVYNNSNIDPCLSYTYGEIEDYNVTISNGVDPFTYTWSPATFLASTTGSSVVASNVTATTTYTLTAVSVGGCSAYGTTTVNVDPLTAVTISGSTGNAICIGGTSTVTATPVGGGAPYTYSWSSGETTAAITATPTVTTTYTVSVTDNCGSSSSNTFVLTVNPLPVVSVTPSSALYCAPSAAITLTASGALTYSWSPAAGLSATTGATVDATPSSATTYTVVGTDVNGCIASATTAISSAAAVAGVTATATPGTVCSGSPVTLTSTSNPYPVQILSENFNGAMTGWTTTNSTTLGSAPAATAWTNQTSPYTYPSYPTFSSNDASMFMLSNSDAGGSGNLTNTSLVSPSFSTVNMASCSLSFFHYYSDFNANDSAMVQVSTNGTTWTTVKKYTATAGTATSFVQDNISLNAYVGQATVYVRFYYRATWGYFWGVDNVAVNATTTSTLTYGWTATPGTFTASTQNATDNPTANTTYTVTVTAPSGCSATATASVTVNPLPTISAGSDVNACPNVQTTLSATGGTSYTWNTGASTASINVMPTSTTTYTVTGTDGNGCMNTDQVAINVLPGANAGTITGPSEVCTGLTATLNVSGSVGTLQWYESTDNNNFTAIGGATSATLTTGALTDTMYYGLVAINGTCSDTTVIHTVNVLNNIVASVSSTNALCNGSATGTATVNISSGVGPFTYSWNTTPTQTTATATGLAASTYSVNVTGAGGCTFAGGAVITEPTAIATPMMSTNPSCFGSTDGDAMVMPSGGTPTYTYSWNTGGMGSMIAGLGAGTYTVTVTDANACTATGTVTLVDPAAVVVTISGNDTICSGTSTTLTASGATTYTWNTSATGSTITESPTATTTYTVTGTVGGCTGTATVNVVVETPVVAGFTYAENQLSVDFTNSSTNAVTYAWDFGDGSTANTQNPTHVYSAVGNYSVQLIASNSCGNDTVMQTIVITSADAIANAGSLSVYPNPSKDVFRITLTDNTAHTVKVKITAANGQLVMEENVDQFNGTYTNNVDLSKYAKGVYTLQITTDTQVMTRRVVLN